MTRVSSVQRQWFAAVLSLVILGVGCGAGATSAPTQQQQQQQQIPPVGNGEPVDPGSGYLWADNFDRYASPVAMRHKAGDNCTAGQPGYGLPDANVTYGRHTEPNFTDGCTVQLNNEGTPRYQLITGRTGTGQALRGAVATRPFSVCSNQCSQGIDWITPWGPTGSNLQPSASKTMVIQMWSRTSVGGHAGPVGMKWLIMWINDATRQRIQWSYLGSNPTLWHPNDGPNTSGFHRTAQPVGPYHNPDLNDGQWHRYTYLYRANSSTSYQHVGGTSAANEVYNGTSSRDGRIAMWVDGIKVMDISQATVGVTPPGGTNPWCYQSDVDWIPHGLAEYLEFPSTINDSDMTWTIDHDDLKIWEF